MALRIDHGKDIDMASKVTVDRRLWLTADNSRVVEDGDPAAAFLWAAEGREVPAGEAERVGYTRATTRAATPDSGKAETPVSDTVACPVDGCDYEGTPRGLKVHVRRHDRDGD